MADQAERVAAFRLQELRRGLGEERGPPFKRRGRDRVDDVDLTADTDSRQCLEQEVAHVCEVRKLPQRGEAEEPWDEQHVVCAGHGRTLSCPSGSRRTACAGTHFGVANLSTRNTSPNATDMSEGRLTRSGHSCRS